MYFGPPRDLEVVDAFAKSVVIQESPEYASRKRQKSKKKKLIIIHSLQPSVVSIFYYFIPFLLRDLTT